MLDQFRHDLSNDSNDSLSDSRFQMSRKKFVYTLSGAALALVFFLFLIGAFRTDKDELLIVDATSSTPDNALQDLQVRVAKLEELLAKQNPSTSIVAQASSQTPSDDLNASLTDDALKQLIDQQQSLDTIAFTSDIDRPDSSSTSEIQPAPTPTPKPAPQPATGRTYVVQKGDTLSKISQRFYGSTKRWKTIYEANRDKIANINNLKVGTKIVIPEETK